MAETMGITSICDPRRCARNAAFENVSDFRDQLPEGASHVVTNVERLSEDAKCAHLIGGKVAECRAIYRATGSYTPAPRTR